MPGLLAEDVVDELTAMGFDCGFDPGGDIPSSWNCGLGDQAANDYFEVGVSSGESGPIEGVTGYRQLGDGVGDAVDAEVLDSLAADAFDDIVVMIVPAERRPTSAELLAGVASNYPMELGGGWYLGFDRNSISRTFHIVYASDPR